MWFIDLTKNKTHTISMFGSTFLFAELILTLRSYLLCKQLVEQGLFHNSWVLHLMGGESRTRFWLLWHALFILLCYYES